MIYPVAALCDPREVLFKLSLSLSADLHQKILQCLSGEKDKTALNLSRELDIPKNSIQRSLYELQKLDKVKKVNDKQWRVCGEMQSEATPIGSSLVPNMDSHLVCCNQPVLNPMEVAVLKELKNLGSCCALKLAKNMGHQSKKHVNPTLYTLERKGLIRKEGSSWLCLSEGHERDTGAQGIGSSSPGRGDTGARRQMPNIQVNNHYNFNLSVTNNLSEENTSINQQGPCTKNISSSVQGNSYLQMGSRNTMNIRDSSQEQQNKRMQGSSETGVTEDHAGGTLELNNTEEPGEGASMQGGTETHDGGALELDSEFNIKIAAEQLSSFQIGNRNQMMNGWDIPREGPPTESSPREGPPTEGHSFESFSSEDSFVWESR